MIEASDPDWNPGDGLARDVHGLVTTYQQIATGPAAAKLAGLSADGFVILDEIHAVARDKRGSHLAVTLERLAALCPRSPARIGLSATRERLEKMYPGSSGLTIGSGTAGGAIVRVELPYRLAAEIA